jgi:hypothetical protein
VGRIRKIEFFDCSIPYERKLQKSSDLSDDERKVFAELSSVMKRYDTQYQSDLSKDAVQQWQKKDQGWEEKEEVIKIIFCYPLVFNFSPVCCAPRSCFFSDSLSGFFAGT